VLQLIHQGYAADEAEAVQKAIRRRGPGHDRRLYRKHSPDSSKRVACRGVVDEAVRRILRVKFELGLFERPFGGAATLTGAAPTPAQLTWLRNSGPLDVLLKKPACCRWPWTCGASRLWVRWRRSSRLLGSWAQQGRRGGHSIEAVARAAAAGWSLRLAPAVTSRRRRRLEAAVRSPRIDVVVLASRIAGMSGENASARRCGFPLQSSCVAVAEAASRCPLVVSGRP